MHVRVDRKEGGENVHGLVESKNKGRENSIGGDERRGARYHRRRNSTGVIGGGEKRAEIFAATFCVDSCNSVKLETSLTGLDGRRAADS